jgi:uncharacterized glyoxalase superfamily protein PhnB
MRTDDHAPAASNRSIPDVTVIPVLHYPDVGEAAAWLVRVFGFAERLRIGDHRIQMTVSAGAGSGAVVVHCTHAQSCGAKILSPPTSYPYGERQYSVADLGGHVWTFTETIADVDPASWGGVMSA